ncbi:host attachment protein [Bosea sp. 2YAB26]|uniref:baeRF12 domain-containing protein n=1 Tax=Bosea sp. 2YAB26 TaxID=3237478 RepID=UPI003F8E366E
MSSSLPLVQRDSWLVVCDGAKALILRNDGDVDRLRLQVLHTMERPSAPDRELGTDRPGRVHQSLGEGRSAVEANSRHAAAEVSFVGEVALFLSRRSGVDRVKRIILIAPPKVLGELRRQLLPAVQALVVAEIVKDLTNLPVGEIERHLLR